MTAPMSMKSRSPNPTSSLSITPLLAPDLPPLNRAVALPEPYQDLSRPPGRETWSGEGMRLSPPAMVWYSASGQRSGCPSGSKANQ